MGLSDVYDCLLRRALSHRPIRITMPIHPITTNHLMNTHYVSYPLLSLRFLDLVGRCVGLCGFVEPRLDLGGLEAADMEDRRLGLKTKI
jgi:hypothetical protein